MKFSLVEIRDLAICWVVLGFCFSFQYLMPSRDLPYDRALAQFAVFFVVALIGIGAGFVFHELAHKGVAQRFGYHAEFRLWKMGLIIAIASAVLSFGKFLFFAPGAVYTRANKYPDPKEEGLISAAGPVVNLIIAGLFYLLSFYGGMLELIGFFGFQINLWLAAFNLVPFPPLDGVKIFQWNKAAWTVMAVLSWGTLLLMMAGVFSR
jgi:Zn-dependent protease